MLWGALCLVAAVVVLVVAWKRSPGQRLATGLRKELRTIQEEIRATVELGAERMGGLRDAADTYVETERILTIRGLGYKMAT